MWLSELFWHHHYRDIEIIILERLKVYFVTLEFSASAFCKQSCFYFASLGNNFASQSYFLCSEWNKGRVTVVQENRWDMKLRKVQACLEKESTAV